MDVNKEKTLNFRYFDEYRIALLRVDTAYIKEQYGLGSSLSGGAQDRTN